MMKVIGCLLKLIGPNTKPSRHHIKTIRHDTKSISQSLKSDGLSDKPIFLFGKSIARHVKLLWQLLPDEILHTMYKLQIRRCEMFRNLDGFIKKNPGFFPDDPYVHQLLQQLDDIFKDLGSHGGDQVLATNHARGGTLQKNKAAAELRAYLFHMVDITRLIARTVPNVEDGFRFARGRSDAALLYTAHSFAEHATLLSETFIKYAPNFKQDLNSLIENVEQAIRYKEVSITALKEATSGIDAAIKKAMDTIAELDVVVANTYRASAVDLSHWKNVRHVQRAARKKKAAAAVAAAGSSVSTSSTDPSGTS